MGTNITHLQDDSSVKKGDKHGLKNNTKNGKRGSKTRFTCADSPDRDRHLITVISVIKRLTLYEFTLWGRDFVSVLEKVGIMEVFFKKICLRILSGKWKLSVIERSPY